jgi:N-acetylmuramate 1-kinase
MITKYTPLIADEIEMSRFASDISLIAKENATIFLFGELGAGKTLFAKKFISQAFGFDENEVSSPTFNIVNCYKSFNGCDIFHYDLYRIEDFNELQEIGLFDNINAGINIIEWPEICKDQVQRIAENLISIYLKRSA